MIDEVKTKGTKGTNARRQEGTKGNATLILRPSCLRASVRSCLLPRLRAFAIIFVLLICGSRAGAAQMRKCETEHYIIHTDVDEELAGDLTRRMDAMFEEYSRRLVEFEPPQGEAKLEVYIFVSRDDYIRFTKNPNSSGVFIPSRKVLAATLDAQGRDGLRRTLQHEAFHQFAFSAIGPELPRWLNEGLAEVFSEGIFVGDHFILGQMPPRRLRVLQHNISQGWLVDFKKFMTLDDEQWNNNMADRYKGEAEYNQAWSMTHFLIFARDESNNPKFRSRLIDMLRTIHKGGDGMAAFTGAFGTNFTGFQQRYVEYIERLEPTPEATYVDRMDVLADMLVDLRGKGKDFAAVESFREYLLKNGYFMKYRKDDIQWDTSKDMKSYFADVEGRQFNSSEMFFEFRQNAPIRDLVCRPMNGLQLRTRFISNGAKYEHETVAERD